MNSTEDQSTSTFEDLFEAHWDRIYRLILRLVEDPAEAEDLALEVFWRLYHRPPANHPGHNLDGWLYRVATNLGYNALRARQRRRKYEQDAAQQRPEKDDVPGPELLLEQKETRRRVRAILAEMKPRAAQILILRHSGLTYAEVAAALDVAVGSVGTLLARAEKDFERRYSRLAERAE